MIRTAEEFASLLTRIREGNKDAEAELTEQYASVIERAARVMLGHLLRPHLDTQDLVQSVHRTLLSGLHKNKFDVSSPAKLIALARALVRHKISRYWRKLKHQPGAIPGMGVNGWAAWAQHCSSRCPEDPAKTVLIEDEFEHLLSRLDEVDGHLLQLRREGYSTAEAAELLNLDPGFLRERLVRLRKRLAATGQLDDWL